MLVQTMTDKEIQNELLKDYEYIYNGSSFLSVSKKYDKFRRRGNVNKKSVHPKFYKVVTPSKNNWFIMVSKPASMEKYKAMDTSLLEFTYYHTPKGIRVFKPIPQEDGTGFNGFSVYNGHVFKRYTERMGLSFDKPLQSVASFFKNNGSSYAKIIEQGEKKYTFSACKDGILLGEVYNGGKWVLHKTFITRDMTGGNQSAIDKSLMEALKTSIEAEINKPSFERDKFNHSADIFAIIKGTQQK